MRVEDVPNWHEAYALVMTVIAATIVEIDDDSGVMAGQAFLAVAEELSDQLLTIHPRDDASLQVSKRSAQILLGLLRFSIENRAYFDIDRDALGD